MTNNNFRRRDVPDGWYWGMFFPEAEPVRVINGEVWRVAWEQMKEQHQVEVGPRIAAPPKQLEQKGRTDV